MYLTVECFAKKWGCTGTTNDDRRLPFIFPARHFSLSFFSATVGNIPHTQAFPQGNHTILHLSIVQAVMQLPIRLTLLLAIAALASARPVVRHIKSTHGECHFISLGREGCTAAYYGVVESSLRWGERRALIFVVNIVFD